MQSKSIFRIIIPLLTLISLSQLCSADVEIPFDYYYGRWVDGHQVGGFYEDQKDRNYDSKSLTYLFTLNRYQFGLDFITRDIIYQRHYDGWMTPIGHFKIRPINNWILGIDNIYYVNNNSITYPTTEDPNYKEYKRNNFNMQVSSNWMNVNSTSLIDFNPVFTYFVKPIVSKKTLKIDNSFRIERGNRISDYVSYAEDTSDYVSFSSDFQDNDDIEIYINNNLQYGLSDNSNIQLYFYYDYSNRKTKYINLRNTRIDKLFDNALTDWDDHRLFYRINFLTSKFNNVLIDISFGQGFEKEDQYTRYINYEVGKDSLVRELVREDDSPFAVDYNTLSANVSFVTKGDFKDRIILDDYNNYYHKMLFDKQLYVNLAIKYDEPYKISSRDEIRIFTYFDCAYGFLNLFEFYYNSEYDWNRREYNNRVFYSAHYENKIGIKFRSFKYSVEQPSKWLTDDNIDIILGPMQGFSKIYTDFSYEPPNYFHNTIDKIGLYSFKKMRSDESANISLLLNLGLGQYFVLNFYCSEHYKKSELQRRDCSVGLGKRILHKLDFSLKYQDSFDEYENPEPIFTATINALF